MTPFPLLLAAAALAASHTAELRLTGGQGCCIDGKGAALWVSMFKSTGNTVYMEAEQAQNLTMQSGKEVGRDPAQDGYHQIR